MHTTARPLDLHAPEKLREGELEEARAIQSVMLPAESLQAGPVTISHEFQPMAAAGTFWTIFNYWTGLSACTSAMFPAKDCLRRCMLLWQLGRYGACIRRELLRVMFWQR